MRPVEKKLYAPVSTENERRQKDLQQAVERRNPDRYKTAKRLQKR